MNRFFLIGSQNVNVMSHIAREIVSNTLAHREYSRAVPAKIVIEKERIYCENWNRARFQGTLDPGGFTPEPKNPLISQFFVNIGLADALGSGMRNLYYYTNIYSGGKAKPVLTEGDLFTTEIPIRAAAAGAIQNVPINEINVPINAPINVPINDTGLQVLHVMNDDPKLSLDEISEKIGKNRKTVQRIIRDLKERGYVKRVGSRKTGYWEVAGVPLGQEGFSGNGDIPL